MAEINVYEQYFEAEGSFNDVERKACLVMLVSHSEAGMIRYEAAVTFFPHRDEEDYAVSYDAYFTEELYSAPGRRSKKREAELLETFRDVIDRLAEENGFTVFWEKPLREERRG
ncbi:MAG: hypothetical protein K6A40_13570 [Solobacterium sp.]|nr:hypothetical protein [Solobacterium sp.]